MRQGEDIGNTLIQKEGEEIEAWVEAKQEALELAGLCICGGSLEKTKTDVDFFGLEFKSVDALVCTSCKVEYLSQETLKMIEDEIKKQGGHMPNL